jgi:hypothetical protein
MSRWEDGGRKVDYAVGLMGRSAERMIPLLNKGKRGFDELSQEAHKTGRIIGNDFIKQGSEAQEAFNRLAAAADSFKLSLSPVALLIAKILEGLAKLATEAKNIPKTEIDARMRLYEMGINPETGLPTPIPRIRPPTVAVWGEGEGIVEPKGINVPPPQLVDEKAQTEALYNVLMTRNKLREEAARVMEGFVTLSTDMIEGYENASVALENFTKELGIKLVGPYKTVTVSIEDYLKMLREEEKTHEAVQEQLSKEFETRKKLGLEYEVPDSLYEQSLSLKKINEELQREIGLQQILDDQEHTLFETRKKTEGLEYEVATPEEIAAMTRRSLEKMARDMQQVRDFWDGLTADMGTSLLTNLFNMARDGFKNMGDHLKVTFNDLLGMIEKLIMNAILFGDIMGQKKTSGGYGGLVGWLCPILGSLAGGGGAAAPASGGAGGGVPGGTTIINIHAIDANSFRDVLRRNGNAVVEIINDNIARRGPVMHAMRNV